MNASFGDIFNQGTLRRLRDEHLRGGRPDPGQQPLGADGRRPSGAAEVREPGARAGRRAGRLELRRAVRRPEQRRHPGPLPDQRLRLGDSQGTSYWYDFSKIAGGNQVDHLRRAGTGRRWATGAWPGYQQKKVWLNDGAGHFTDVAQAVGVDRSLRRPLGRPRPTSGTAACSTSSSPTSAGRCCSIATRWRRTATGSSSTSTGGCRSDTATTGARTAARSARR